VSDRALRRLAVPETPFHLDALLTDAGLTGGLTPKLGGKWPAPQQWSTKFVSPAVSR
jgi:hypothetical protein